MTENERLTHKRANGQGYWTQRKKEELLMRLAAYENTGLTPEEIQNGQKQNAGKIREIATIMPDDDFRKYLDELRALVEAWKADGLGYISLKCQLVETISQEDAGEVFTVGQLQQIFALAR
jgi:hypothetical protein